MTWHTDCLRRRLETTRAEIERVAKKDHPGTTARLLFKGLSFIAGRLLQRLDNLTRLPDPEELSAAVTLEIIKLGHVFSHVSRVDSARIPFELVPALAWACSDLLQRKNCQVLLRLSDQGYSIIRLQDLLGVSLWTTWESEFVKDLVNKRAANRLADEYQRFDLQDLDIVIVGIPTADARSILLHALIAHELGHEVFNSVDIERTHAFKAHAAEQAAQSKIATDKLAEVKEILDSQPTEMLGNRHVGWLCELFADMVAARLLGPPYLAAAGRIFLGTDAVASETHPHVQMRREAVRYYLKNGMKGTYEWTLTHPSFAVALAASTSNDWLLQDEHKAAAEVCRDCFPQMADLVDQTVKIDVFGKQTKYEEAYEAIATAVSHLAPVPAEVQGQWSDGSAIFWLMLSCAWTLRFDDARFKDFKDKFAHNGDATEAEAEHRLDNLLLHSLRSAEIRHRHGLRPPAGEHA